MSMHANLVFLYAGFNPSSNTRVNKHYQGYSSLQFMTAGGIELYYDQTRYILDCNAGSTTWFWPSTPGPRTRFHAAFGHEAWTHRWVSFTGPLVDHWKQTGLWLSAPQVGPRGEVHAATFDELIFHVQRGGDWAMRRAGNLLENLLLELAEARSSDTTEPWLQETQHFIAECSDFTPNYEALARELGISLPTLRRKFKLATGITIHEALLQRRIRDARRLLAETDMPIKAVATTLGYQDVYFFSNQFKQRTLFSPAAFRQSHQK